MGALFDQYPGRGRKGSGITISHGDIMIFVSERDEVFLYTGICPNDDSIHYKGLNCNPYTMHGLHSTNRSVRDMIRNFYRIADGCIYLDYYVDSISYKDERYKQIKAGLALATTCVDYGVRVNGQDDIALTRAVFGLTLSELSDLVNASAKVLSFTGDYSWFPRLTRSVNRDNYCDLTGAWIPAKFPYIAFAESGCDFSHVSLWGFYRLIQLHTYGRLESQVSKVLLEAGIEKSLLNRVFELGKKICDKDICRAD